MELSQTDVFVSESLVEDIPVNSDFIRLRILCTGDVGVSLGVVCLTWASDTGNKAAACVSPLLVNAISADDFIEV